MLHRGKKNSDVAIQVLLIAHCFKQAHARKAWHGAHQTLACAISHPPDGQYNIVGRTWTKAKLSSVAAGVLAKRGLRYTANFFVLRFLPL